MDHSTLVSTIGSAAFAMTFTAALRKLWPSLDGKWVALVVVVLAALSSLATEYAASMPAWAWSVIGMVVAGVGAIGANEWAARLATKVKGE